MQSTKTLLPDQGDGKIRHQKVKRWKEWDFMGRVRHHKKVERFCDGKRHGNSDVFINGKIDSSTQYVDGEMHGTERVWFESGRLSMVTHYFEGKCHGVHKTFHEDGTIAWETRYVQDKPFDDERFWAFEEGKSSKKQSER